MANLNKIREALQQQAVVVASVALLVVLLMVWWVSLNLGLLSTQAAAPRAYFIDEETGETSIHLADEIPPLLGKSGKPTVVQLIYYTCGSCADRKPAYYRKFTPETREILKKVRTANLTPATPSPSASGPDGRTNPWILLLGAGQGELVRLPQTGSPWIPLLSAPGSKLVEELSSKCPDPTTFQLCVP